MAAAKDIRLLITRPDGSITDVSLTGTVHTESGWDVDPAEIASLADHFHLAGGKKEEARVGRLLKEDTTISSLSDAGTFWGGKSFEGTIIVTLAPSELWRRINEAQVAGQACVDLTDVTGSKAGMAKIQSLLSPAPQS